MNYLTPTFAVVLFICIKQTTTAPDCSIHPSNPNCPKKNITDTSTESSTKAKAFITEGTEFNTKREPSNTEGTDSSTLTSTENTLIADASKTDEVEFAFGVVLAVVFTCTIVAVIIGFIVIKLRKKRQKAEKNAYSYIDTPVPASTNVMVVSNLAYNDSPLIETTDKSNKIDKSPNYSFTEPIEIKIETGNYSFAKPILPESNNPNNACYDHPSNLSTNIGQPGKKSTPWLIKDNHTAGTYDHLSGFKREEETVNDTNSSYDHIQPNAECDTYYDVSGTGIQGDGVDYDHLPPNINTDPSTDYVSTQNFSVQNNADGYDHFELK